MKKFINDNIITLCYWAAILGIAIGAAMAGLNPAYMISVTIMPLMCAHASNRCSQSLRAEINQAWTNLRNIFTEDGAPSKAQLSSMCYYSLSAINLFLPTIALPALTALAFRNKCRHVNEPGEQIQEALSSISYSR